MIDRTSALILAILSLVFLVMGGLSALFLPNGLLWGGPFLLIGVVNLLLLPLFWRERMPPEDTFQPLDSSGRALVGSPQVRDMAEIIARELHDTPHRVLTAPHSVRVEFDSGTFHQPGPLPSLRQFQWRTTLVGSPHGTRYYLRLDQKRDQRDGGLWRQGSASAGRQVSGSVRMSVGSQGTTTQAVTTLPIDHAIKTALAETGARTKLGAAAVAAIVNAFFGILGAIIGAVAALTV